MIGARDRRLGADTAALATTALAALIATAGLAAAAPDVDSPRATSAATPTAHIKTAPAAADIAVAPKLAPDPLAQLTEELDALRVRGPLNHGTTALYIADAATGAPLFQVHADEHLNPASNVKLISTAATLDILGPDWRYTTHLLGPAPRATGDGRIIDGDLYLRGGYDPMLRPSHLAKLARSLADAGVTAVTGRVVVGPDSRRGAVGRSRVTLRITGTDQGEPPAVEMTPANSFVHVEMRAETKRVRRSHVTAQGYLIEPADGSGPASRYVVAIDGAIRPGTTRVIRRRLPRPATFAGHVLRAALIEAGVDVGGGVAVMKLDDYIARSSRAGALPIELARHQSASLRRLVSIVNKRSVNWLADWLIMTAGAHAYGGRPTMDKAVRAMHAWLERRAGIHASDVVLDTGSGLSYQTELTAAQIVRVLRVAGGYAERDRLATGSSVSDSRTFARGPITVVSDDRTAAATGRTRAANDDANDDDANDDDANDGGDDGDDDMDDGDRAGDPSRHQHTALQRVFLSSLAVGGVDGTLRGRFRHSPARGEVHAKTGTLTRVIALSGIIEGPDDRDVAFSIVSNGHIHRKRRYVRKQHEALVEAIYRYLHAPPVAANNATAAAGDASGAR